MDIKCVSFNTNIQFFLIIDSSLLRLMADSFGMTIHLVRGRVVVVGGPGAPPQQNTKKKKKN